jgi:hypothetical protein
MLDLLRDGVPAIGKPESDRLILGGFFRFGFAEESPDMI